VPRIQPPDMEDFDRTNDIEIEAEDGEGEGEEFEE